MILTCTLTTGRASSQTIQSSTTSLRFDIVKCFKFLSDPTRYWVRIFCSMGMWFVAVWVHDNVWQPVVVARYTYLISLFAHQLYRLLSLSLRNRSMTANMRSFCPSIRMAEPIALTRGRRRIRDMSRTSRKKSILWKRSFRWAMCTIFAHFWIWLTNPLNFPGCTWVEIINMDHGWNDLR